MNTGRLFAENALCVLGLMTGLWLYSVYRKDASIVDPWWSVGFWLVYTRSVWVMGRSPAKLLLWAMVTLWAWRLAVHLWVRSVGKPEDPRYQAFRRRFGEDRYWWISFFQVFLLQGALMLVISTPLQLAAAAPAPDRPWENDWLGAAVFAVGFGFEVIGDWQLARFRKDPANQGKALDTGLWRYTRHPNYFGEALIWWGFWLCAFNAPEGITSVFSPLLMTFLLLRVSGVTMLERQLRQTRPGYEAYIQRTSAFVPWPPRRS